MSCGNPLSRSLHVTTKIGIPDDWTATPDNVSALPEPRRRYIHDLQTTTDPAGLVLGNFTLRQENAGLRLECEASLPIREDDRAIAGYL